MKENSTEVVLKIKDKRHCEGTFYIAVFSAVLSVSDNKREGERE